MAQTAKHLQEVQKIKQPSTQYTQTEAKLCHPFHNQLLQHHQSKFQVLLNTPAKWKMKNTKLSESAVFLPSVDVNISHPTSKMVMEMNEEAKIFCVGFFCLFVCFIFKLCKRSAISNFTFEAEDLNQLFKSVLGSKSNVEHNVNTVFPLQFYKPRCF